MPISALSAADCLLRLVSDGICNRNAYWYRPCLSLSMGLQMINLYQHQDIMINGVREAFRRYRRVLLQAPTGTGKTVMATFIHDSACKRNKESWFICHRVELLEQTAKTFDKNGLDYGLIASGKDKHYDRPIQICSIDTLKNRLGEVKDPALIAWDECAHIGAAGWAKVMASFDCFHLGLTATPVRQGGIGLGSWFDYMVLGPQIRWLIDNGYLANYRLFSIPGIDRGEIGSRAGEFKPESAAEAIDKPQIMGDMVEHWLRHAKGKKTIQFAPTIAQSIKFANQFNSAGIPWAHLDAKTDKNERKEVLQALARGGIMGVSNVNLFSEGFDVAANSGMDVTIGCVIDGYASRSLGMVMQRWGRALRRQDGYAIILDHAGNAGPDAHGFPCSHREWSLYEGKQKQTKGQDNGLEEKARQCPKCYAWHDPSPKCPVCGHVYTVKPREIDHVDGELIEMTPEQQAAKQGRMKQGQAKDLASLVALGHTPERAAHILEARAVKVALQTKLFNLSVAAKAGLLMREIRKMKPKQLKAEIEKLTAQIGA